MIREQSNLEGAGIIRLRTVRLVSGNVDEFEFARVSRRP